jgi:hypothetical protein
MIIQDFIEALGADYPSRSQMAIFLRSYLPEKQILVVKDLDSEGKLNKCPA